ncbi:MAG: M23 family metallopeptidase [Gammaproteobacteria bacterium]|nr:M23 family metallopeptidase [Gammaproteobacteria bacterium]
MKKISYVLLLLIVSYSHLLQAEELAKVTGEFQQGGLLIGQTTAGTKVNFNGEPVLVSDSGYFVVGLARKAPNKMRIMLESQQGKKQILEEAIKQRSYSIARVNGVADNKVNLTAADAARNTQERSLILAARAKVRNSTEFLTGFIWPVKGRLSGEYGSQRVINGEARSPHFGVDVAMPEGTAIVAPADGVVTLVHPNMFFTGQTLMLDHGLAVTSIYAHLSKIVVAEGDVVKQGQKIGEIGMTGRATGPHLHWGVYWGDTGLDPMLLTGPMNPVNKPVAH